MNGVGHSASVLLQKAKFRSVTFLATHSSFLSEASPDLPKVLQQQQRNFASKYISKSAKKRLPMTTKRAGKGFYKGNGGTKEGKLTSKGKFIPDPQRKLQLMVPQDLDSFPLKPYIASTASRFPPEIRRRPGQMI
ncbi:mitochondrial ribosomal protein L27 [Nitzschia inconspicua]|uniref:Mitochondrial ribosomal protein L27 n=1 Tax=Nitzschia inconspicua TaxID=303405 RepID=A0A9K3M1G0_9STRA|nr:mitochondrial ribosomal protein L27 [Nitzschia inconspicua]